MTEKVCTQCNLPKPIECFYKVKRGTVAKCMSCVDKYNRAQDKMSKRAFRKPLTPVLVKKISEDHFVVLGPFTRKIPTFDSMDKAYSFAKGKWPDNEILVQIG